MDVLKTKSIKLSLNGSRHFYKPDVLLPILDLFQKYPLFTPETWSIDGRTNRPYNQDHIANLGSGEESPYILQIKRSKRIKYTSMVRFSNRPGMSVELAPSTPAKDWGEFFEFSDALAATYHPEIAWAHLSSDLRPPFENSTTESTYLMDAGVTGISIDYIDYGPCGLGLRTYLGPHLVELFSRDLLLTTPAVVTELSWGGIRIDLVEQPWQASLEDLLVAWQQAMDYLRSANVFAESYRGQNGYIYFKRNKRFRPGFANE